MDVGSGETVKARIYFMKIPSNVDSIKLLRSSFIIGDDSGKQEYDIEFKNIPILEEN